MPRTDKEKRALFLTEDKKGKKVVHKREVKTVTALYSTLCQIEAAAQDLANALQDEIDHINQYKKDLGIEKLKPRNFIKRYRINKAARLEAASQLQKEREAIIQEIKEEKAEIKRETSGEKAEVFATTSRNLAEIREELEDIDIALQENAPPFRKALREEREEAIQRLKAERRELLLEREALYKEREALHKEREVLFEGDEGQRFLSAKRKERSIKTRERQADESVYRPDDYFTRLELYAAELHKRSLTAIEQIRSHSDYPINNAERVHSSASDIFWDTYRLEHQKKRHPKELEKLHLRVSNLAVRIGRSLDKIDKTKEPTSTTSPGTQQSTPSEELSAPSIKGILKRTPSGPREDLTDLRTQRFRNVRNDRERML